MITIDIETENTGYDILEHNKRIISVQMLDDNKSKIYYDGFETNNLSLAKSEIISCIERDTKFVGYNIRNFDIPLIKKFFDIHIPSEQIIEISEMDLVNDLRKKMMKNKLSLFQVCSNFGIDAGHKKEMDELAQKFINDPKVIEYAKKGAMEWVTQKGWGKNFSFELALKRITGGMAILDSFNDFVESGGDTTKLFYKYAMKDVEVESQLYNKLSRG